MSELFSAETLEAVTDERYVNPCVRLHGLGPEGRKCWECKHIFQSHGYPKCDLRAFTRGSATDHRMKWAACAKFEDKTAS